MGKKVVVLALILILAFILRVYKIDSLPMYGDELTLAYDSYSILKTGKDQTGQFLPLTFAMRGGSPPAYVYFSLPAVFLFGPTALGVRILSLISGLGIIVLAYFIAKKFFSEKHGLISAALVAVSPWAINLSRGGFESNFALFLSMCGATLFLYSEKKHLYWIFGALCFGLAIFTYPTYKLLVPLFGIILIWYLGGLKFFFSSNSMKYLLAVSLVVGLFAVLLGSQILLNNSERRFLNTNIFNQDNLRESIIQKVNSERTLSTAGALSNLFHNKPVEYFVILRDAYLNHFSSNFLFVKGDGNPRHNMTETGEFYFVDIFLILISLMVFIGKRAYQREFKFLIAWILISPLASTFLGEIHALRSSLIFLPISLISSVGLVYLVEKKEPLLPVGLPLALIFFIQFIFSLEKLYFISPAKFAGFWSGRAKEVVEMTESVKGKYHQIFISKRIDNIEFAYPVYAKIDPNDVIAQDGREVKEFGNVKIIDIEDIDPKSVNKNTLVISE